MAYRRLTDFLEELGQAGELARVEVEVAPDLEVAEIADRTIPDGGAAVLFTSTGENSFPIVAGVLGSTDRLCLLLGARSLGQVTDRLAGFVSAEEPRGWLERLKGTPHLAASGRFSASEIRTGACQQVVELGDDVDLTRRPLTRSAAEETYRAITAGVVLAGEGGSGVTIGGHFPMQLLGARRLACCWDNHDAVAALSTEYRQRGEKMPIAIVLGGPPSLLLAAMAPVNNSVDSPVDMTALAGLLADESLEVVTCRTTPLRVPAEAEVVIEGYIDPGESLVEAGPIRMAAGHCRPARKVPAMHVTAVTRRANPVIPVMVTGERLCEASVVRRALARVFLPWVKAGIPEVVDYSVAPEGRPSLDVEVGRWVSLSIHKTHAGQARRVAQVAWSQRQFMFAKVLVVVDAEVDVHDTGEVLAAIARNMNPARDVIITQGPPDPADAATSQNTLGQFMAIDATRKLPGEYGDIWPQTATIDADVRQLVAERWEGYGLGPRNEKTQ